MSAPQNWKAEEGAPCGEREGRWELREPPLIDRAQASPLRSSPRVLLCPDDVTSLPLGAVKWDVAAGGPRVGGQPPHPLVIAPLAIFHWFP